MKKNRSSKDLFWILSLTGIFGFFYGSDTFPFFQSSTEVAQVLAGIVKYPDHNNPFYIYQNNLWCIITQISAIALKLGVLEKTVSVLTSGFMAMLAMQGVALVTYALGGNAPIAIATSYVAVTRALWVDGVNYPVLVINTVHTFGAFGLILAIWTLGAFGSGAYRIGAFLLGIAPAIHPAMGLSLWGVLGSIYGIYFFIDPWISKELFGKRKNKKDPWIVWNMGGSYFCVGLSFTLLSLGFHLFNMESTPSLTEKEKHDFLLHYIAKWDYHRNLTTYLFAPFIYNIEATLLCIFILYGHKNKILGLEKKLFLPRKIFIWAFCVYFIIGAISYGLNYWVPFEDLPMSFLIAMPTRFLTINNAVYLSMIIGFCCLFLDSFLVQIQLGFFLWIITLVPSQFTAAFLYSIPILILTVVASHSVKKLSINLNFFRQNFTLFMCLFMGVCLAREYPQESKYTADFVVENLYQLPTTDRSSYLLASPDLEHVQYQTRRPLLRSSILDFIPYNLNTGIELNRILKKIDGLDLLYTPIFSLTGSIPAHYVKPIWEARSLAGWQEIKNEFHVSEILTGGGWNLNLPYVLVDGNLRLYRIP